MAETEKLDSSKDKSNWGGARPNAGRPTGSMNEATKERMQVKAAFQTRVAQSADRLFNAQFNLAVGEQYLMWKHKVGSGTKERTVVEVVDDQQTIIDYLDGTLDEDKSDDEYYYISTKPANGMAIDSMLDRTFGKAEQSMKLGNDPENPLEFVAAPPELVKSFVEFMKNKKPDGPSRA